MNRWDLYDYYYYNGSCDRLLDRLKYQYGIILCKKLYNYSGGEDQFMYYDSIKRRDVYKPSASRKTLILQYYYYDFNTKKPVQIIQESFENKKYSGSFIEKNFKRADEIDIDSLARDLKLKKIMKKIKNVH